MIRYIQIFDRNGKLLIEQPAKSTATRVSVRAAAWQRQLDSLLTPEAAEAYIGDTAFKIVKGKSFWSGPKC